MNRTKKAAPVDQTEGGEGCQQMAFAGVFGYDSDFITGRTDPQGISDYLMHGAVNAVPLRELCRLTGLDERAVRVKIHKERLAGVPILSNCRTGYYLAGTNAEKDRCVKSMLHRAAEIAKAASAIEAAEVTDFEGKN